MAEFSERTQEFQNAGATLVALSVDPPERAEEVRRQYGISFPVLCDVDHRVVRDWNLYNAEERGGLAIPAVFLLAPDLRVLFARSGSVVSRIRAEDLLAALSSLMTLTGEPLAVPCNRAIIPRLRDFARAFGAALRVKFGSPGK